MGNTISKFAYVWLVLMLIIIAPVQYVQAQETGGESMPYDHEINSSNVTIVSSQRLRKLYASNESLGIIGDGYTIIVQGKDVVNYENRLYTDINLQKEEGGATFEVNKGNPLCGDITIKLSDDAGKYVYLYNKVLERYERLDVDDTQNLHITSEGKYLITNRRMQQDYGWIVYMLIAIAVVIVGGGAAYIVVKKKYWFW